MKAFDLDEMQADAILETRLYQLARLEIDKIREEQREKEKRAREIEALLKSTEGALEDRRDRAARDRETVRRQAPHGARAPAPSSSTTPRRTSCTKTRPSC